MLTNIIENTNDTPSSIATNAAPAQGEFIPPSSIGILLEGIDAYTANKTFTNVTKILMLVISPLELLH